jgi:hypothetical protein
MASIYIRQDFEEDWVAGGSATIPRQLQPGLALGDRGSDAARRVAFYPGSVNTFYNVVVGQTRLDCTVHIRSLSVD